MSGGATSYSDSISLVVPALITIRIRINRQKQSNATSPAFKREKFLEIVRK